MTAPLISAAPESYEQRIGRLIKKVFERSGFTFGSHNSKEEPEFSFLAIKNNVEYAVKMRTWERPVPANTVGGFLEFCEKNGYEQGIIISISGFSQAAIAIALTEGKASESSRILLGHYIEAEDRIIFIPREPLPPPLPKPTVYISVFTEKGGVGKTTIAAHLAGAFTLLGNKVAIIDADQNLDRIAGIHGHVQVPNVRTKEPHVLQVFNVEGWAQAEHGEYRIVITDCSPTFEKNPESLMNKTSVFISPVHLSPLNLGIHGEVFHRTYGAIRKANKDAHILALVNDYPRDLTRNQDQLMTTLRLVTRTIINDSLTSLIEPKECVIRSSQLLGNWGHKPDLAFIGQAGRCYPREDFLKLADYIEENIFSIHN